MDDKLRLEAVERELQEHIAEDDTLAWVFRQAKQKESFKRFANQKVERIKELEKTLKFYANRNNHITNVRTQEFDYVSEMDLDYGEKARQALEGDTHS